MQRGTGHGNPATVPGQGSAVCLRALAFCITEPPLVNDTQGRPKQSKSQSRASEASSSAGGLVRSHCTYTVALHLHSALCANYMACQVQNHNVLPHCTARHVVTLHNSQDSKKNVIFEPTSNQPWHLAFVHSAALLEPSNGFLYADDAVHITIKTVLTSSLPQQNVPSGDSAGEPLLSLAKPGDKH